MDRKRPTRYELTKSISPGYANSSAVLDFAKPETSQPRETSRADRVPAFLDDVITR